MADTPAPHSIRCAAVSANPYSRTPGNQQRGIAGAGASVGVRLDSWFNTPTPLCPRPVQLKEGDPEAWFAGPRHGVSEVTEE